MSGEGLMSLINRNVKGFKYTTWIPHSKGLFPKGNYSHLESVVSVLCIQICLLVTWYVFYAGDARASEQPALAAIQTLFLREHNRLAEGLSALNPQWSDEKLYQTARRILSAVTQHITYHEFLPRLFGWDGVHQHSLTLQTEGYYQGQTTFPLSH